MFLNWHIMQCVQLVCYTCSQLNDRALFGLLLLSHILHTPPIIHPALFDCWKVPTDFQTCLKCISQLQCLSQLHSVCWFKCTATTFLANWLPHAPWRHATLTPPTRCHYRTIKPNLERKKTFVLQLQTSSGLCLSNSYHFNLYNSAKMNHAFIFPWGHC